MHQLFLKIKEKKNEPPFLPTDTLPGTFLAHHEENQHLKKVYAAYSRTMESIRVLAAEHFSLDIADKDTLTEEQLELENQYYTYLTLYAGKKEGIIAKLEGHSNQQCIRVLEAFINDINTLAHRIRISFGVAPNPSEGLSR